MNINDILLNNNRITDSRTLSTESAEAAAKASPSSADAVLESLKAGDSLRAKVVSRDGNQVLLALPGNKEFTAKISEGINLDIGKLLTFEVKSAGSGLFLSPLFTNLSSDPNISKALNMAGLPVNEDSAAMTKSMMQAGMSVDRQSLSNVFRDVSNFSEYPVNDIVDLHKLGIKVNENNLNQLESYKNLSYQIGEGMNEVASNLGELVSNLTGSGEDAKAAEVLGKLIDIANENVPEKTGEAVAEENVNQAGTPESVKEDPQAAGKQIDLKTQENINAQSEAVTDKTAEEPALSPAERALKLISESQKDLNVREEESNTQNKPAVNENNAIENEKASAEVKSFNKTEINESTRETLAGELKNITGREDLQNKSFNELLDISKQILSDGLSGKNTAEMHRLLGNENIRDIILSGAAAKWEISPAEVADKEKVMELYSRLTRQLKEVADTLEAVGLKDSPAGQSAQNMSNNLDFLNQVNQMYSYIQLPIKLSGGDSAHGDLYVYSNKNKLSSKDGVVTALLHLDMEHLGPVDVHVTLDTTMGKKISTRFYVADDSILDFLSEHIDELNSRLEKKGYNVTAKMTVKGSPEAKEDPFSDAAYGGGINGILSQTGTVKLAEYSFDVRT